VRRGALALDRRTVTFAGMPSTPEAYLDDPTPELSGRAGALARRGVSAVELWYALRDRSETDRRFVLAALISDPMPWELARQSVSNGRGARQIDIAPLWAAFWRFVEASSEHSNKAYRRWRALQSDGDDLPSASTLMRHLGEGSWTNLLVLARLRLGADPLAQRLVARGAAFSRAEVVGAVELWLGELIGPAMINVFVRDVQATLATGSYRGPRLPRSSSPIMRFGGWAALLDEADPDESLRRAAHARLAGLSPTVDRRGSNGFVYTPVVAHGPGIVVAPYSRAELRSWIRRAQALLGDWTAAPAYDRLVRTWREEQLRSGLRPRVPGSARAQQLLGMSWLEALRWAGDLQGPWPKHHGGGRQCTRQELIDAVDAAMDEMGEDLSCIAYGRWREQRQQAAPAAGRAIRVPSASAVAANLGDGSFPGAMAFMRARRGRVRRLSTPTNQPSRDRRG
jgi:hypothetical protein